MADRFEDLRNFVAIAESGGVNSAAARLGIAKSAVSRRLGEFEQRLGVQLADRSGRRFALTAVGAGVLADAQRLLADLDRLETNAARTDHAEPLSVRADRDLLEVVARAAAEMRRSSPEVEIALADHGDDAATLTFSVMPGDGGGRVVGRFRRCVYARRGTPAFANPAALRETDAVSIGTADASEWRFDGVEVAPRIVMSTPDLRSGLAAAAAGAGVVRAPEWAVADAPWRDLLVETLRPASADVAVVATMAGASDGRADRLVDLVAEVLRSGR